MNFTENDIKQIENHGLTLSDVKKQLELLKTGINYSDIQAFASIDQGILPLNDSTITKALSLFEARKSTLSLVKFVPASGEATRMFTFLFQFLKTYNPAIQSLNNYIDQNNAEALNLFFNEIENFPFYEIVLKCISDAGIDYKSLNPNEKALTFVKAMLQEKQLNYGNCPKGLFPFHKYTNNITTAFEEHLLEMAYYGSKNDTLKLHFTILEAHKNKFNQELSRIKKRIEKLTDCTYAISFSYQHKSTDTVALNSKNEVFRNDDGSIYFRPSGHGALLKNLNAIDADLIFINNIDNVVVSQHKAKVIKYNKILAGILLDIQEEAFNNIKLLKSSHIDENQLNTIAKFLKEKLNVHIPETFKNQAPNHKIDYLLKKLNRPFRVCGMVKNEGSPGGGPFWVKDEDGKLSLQIVESTQINSKDQNHKTILENATHFNPVNIVCSIKDYQGNNFNLQDFVDKNTAFITTKTKDGKPLKALELPGLWNGSMAHWNTIFVEVPITTFNPVKTVNDLLKHQHQSHKS